MKKVAQEENGEEIGEVKGKEMGEKKRIYKKRIKGECRKRRVKKEINNKNNEKTG